MLELSGLNSIILLALLVILAIAIKLKNKILFVSLIAIVVIMPLFFTNIVQPMWKNRIVDGIEAANYCTVDSDCVADYFDGITCGSYANKNEIGNIHGELRLYRLLSFDLGRCMGGILPKPECKSGKCAGSGQLGD